MGWWKVKFSAWIEGEKKLYHIDNHNCLSLDGVLTVNAHDIFGALKLASDRVESFGFDRYEVHGAEKVSDSIGMKFTALKL